MADVCIFCGTPDDGFGSVLWDNSDPMPPRVRPSTCKDTGKCRRRMVATLDAKDAEIARLNQLLLYEENEHDRHLIKSLCAKPPATAQTAEWRTLRDQADIRPFHKNPEKYGRMVSVATLLKIRAALTQAADAVDGMTAEAYSLSEGPEIVASAEEEIATLRETLAFIAERAEMVRGRIMFSRRVGDIASAEGVTADALEFIAAAARQALGIEPVAEVRADG